VHRQAKALRTSAGTSGESWSVKAQKGDVPRVVEAEASHSSKQSGPLDQSLEVSEEEEEG